MSVVRGRELSCAQQESEPLSCSLDIWRVRDSLPFGGQRGSKIVTSPQIMTPLRHPVRRNADRRRGKAPSRSRKRPVPRWPWRSSTRSHATSRATTSCTPLEPPCCGGSDVKRRRYTHSIWRLSWRREHASADSSTGSEGRATGDESPYRHHSPTSSAGRWLTAGSAMIPDGSRHFRSLLRRGVR
jgi:hypothetical protein